MGLTLRRLNGARGSDGFLEKLARYVRWQHVAKQLHSTGLVSLCCGDGEVAKQSFVRAERQTARAMNEKMLRPMLLDCLDDAVHKPRRVHAP